MKTKRIKKTFARQTEEKDCGAVCLLSVIRYYGGHCTLERIRTLAGTAATGTTMLGLRQAAIELGLDAEGCEAEVDLLAAQEGPVILHVVAENRYQHYLVCYGCIREDNRERFVIGDPAKGILCLDREEIKEIWQSKACLLLKPNLYFKMSPEINNAKRRWIRELIRSDIPVLTMIVAMGVGVAILNLVMIVFSQELIDDILPGKDMAKLELGIGLVFFLLTAKEVFSALRQFFLLRQFRNFNIRIVDRFYSHLLCLPKSFFDTRKTGELTARLNDTERIQRVIGQVAGALVIDLLVAVFTIILLFVYSWQVAMACLVTLPFYFLLIHRYNKTICEGQRTIMSNYALSEANFIATLQGIEPIKNYNKHSLFSDTNRAIYGNYQGEVFRLGKVGIRISVVSNMFGIVFLAGILLFTGNRVIDGQMHIGEMMAILGMATTLLPGVAKLALAAIPLQEARIAFDRMFEFTGIEPENDRGRLAIRDFRSLHVLDLSFRFPGRRQLLKNVSFKVAKGEIIAILGESGSGKTTLTRLLQKYYRPESGKIILNDAHDLSGVTMGSWRRLIAVVPQHIHIFSGTVLENIAFEDAASRTREILLFLKYYGLDAFIDTLPQSFMTLVGEEGINLSGGQKQLIALARALYHRPQLLILDEATAAMDRQSEQFVLALLKKIRNNMGIIFITHRLHILKSLCDHIYILQNATITAGGKHQQLLETKNLYSEYWNDLMAG